MRWLGSALTAATQRLEPWLERKGYILVPGPRYVPVFLGRHLRQLFDHEKIDVVLDVGANEGQFRDFLREEVRYSGFIHSFEPNSRLATLLQQRQVTSDTNWKVHHCGIGNEPGEMILNIMETETFSSFREPSAIETDIFSNFNKVNHREKVAVHRLDHFPGGLTGLEGGRVYLKTDTQGFDIHVMEGAEEILRYVKALQFEVPFKRIYAGMPGYQAMLSEAEKRGFEVSSFAPVTFDRNLSSIEMDCVLVKKES